MHRDVGRVLTKVVTHRPTPSDLLFIIGHVFNVIDQDATLATIPDANHGNGQRDNKNGTTNDNHDDAHHQFLFALRTRQTVGHDQVGRITKQYGREQR